MYPANSAHTGKTSINGYLVFRTQHRRLLYAKNEEKKTPTEPTNYNNKSQVLCSFRALSHYKSENDKQMNSSCITFSLGVCVCMRTMPTHAF